MVALCFLGGTSIASEHFKNCFCRQSHGCLSWDPFFALFLYVGIPHCIGSVRLDLQSHGGSLGLPFFLKTAPPPSRFFVFPQTGVECSRPVSLNGMLSRAWVLCRTSSPAPCHGRDESPGWIPAPRGHRRPCPGPWELPSVAQGLWGTSWQCRTPALTSLHFVHLRISFSFLQAQLCL